jgi:putative inorganic carbon (hco3(-)) transporter
MRTFAFLGFLICFVPIIFVNPYTGVLLYSWLSFMSPHRLMWDFPSVIPLVMITVILTLVGWFLSRQPKRLPFDATVGLILAFMAWISFTTLLALNLPSAYVSWDRTIKELLFLLITIALTTNRIRCHALLWVMTLSIGFFGLKGGVFSLLHGGDFLVWGPPETAIADNNDLGAGLTVALPLMNYVRMNSGNRQVRAGLLVVMAASIPPSWELIPGLRHWGSQRSAYLSGSGPEKS